jgi:hypothetical protein
MATADSTVEYRDIPGFPGYRVGSDGSVWFAWITCRAGRKLTSRWKLMKPGVHRKGYLCVNLTPPEGGRYQTFRVHRLVLGAFVGPCPEGMECRHLNGIKADCRLENLAWGTPEQNRQDSRDLGSYDRGSDHSQARLTEADVRAIRTRYAAGAFQRELAVEFGVSLPNISAIVNHHSWKHLD